MQKRFKGSTHDWCHQDAFEGISTYNLHDLPSFPLPKAGEREGSITMTYWSYAGLCGDLFPQFFPYLIQAVDKNLPGILFLCPQEKEVLLCSPSHKSWSTRDRENKLLPHEQQFLSLIQETNILFLFKAANSHLSTHTWGKKLFPGLLYLRNTSNAIYTQALAHKSVIRITQLNFSEAESRVAANIQFSLDILHRTPCS